MSIFTGKWPPLEGIEIRSDYFRPRIVNGHTILIDTISSYVLVILGFRGNTGDPAYDWCILGYLQYHFLLRIFRSLVRRVP